MENGPRSHGRLPIPVCAEPALNPDPAALDTLAEGAPCAASDGESPPGECSHPIEQRLFLTEAEAADFLKTQVPSRCHATGFPGTVLRIASWEGPSGITAPISWPGRGQDVMGMPANGTDRLAPFRRQPVVPGRLPAFRFEARLEPGS